jgi:hypothetical protein
MKIDDREIYNQQVESDVREHNNKKNLEQSNQSQAIPRAPQGIITHKIIL